MKAATREDVLKKYCVLTDYWSEFMEAYDLINVNNKVAYKEYIEKIRKEWISYSTKCQKEGKKTLFLRDSKNKLVRDIDDPRWKAFHPKDLKFWDENVFGRDRLIEKSIRKFVCYVNNQITNDNLDESLVPEPMVPQPFQGNIIEATFLILLNNPGKDSRIDQTKDINMVNQMYKTREGILKNIVASINESRFPSLIEESRGIKGYYWGMIYGNSKNTTTKSHYLLNEKDFPFNEFANIDLFPYQTKNFQSSSLSSKIYDTVYDLPSVAVMLNFLEELFSYKASIIANTKESKEFYLAVRSFKKKNRMKAFKDNEPFLLDHLLLPYDDRNQNINLSSTYLGTYSDFLSHQKVKNKYKEARVDIYENSDFKKKIETLTLKKEMTRNHSLQKKLSDFMECQLTRE